MNSITKNDLIYKYREIMDAYIQEVLNEYNSSREASALIATLYTQVKSQLHNYDVETLERHVHNTRGMAIARFPCLKNTLRQRAE
jgi:isopropylmalate/homocitrate/citramalate synthase